MNNCIRVERARHQISHADLAEKIRISRQTILAIENKKFVPSTVPELKIPAIFQLRVEEYFS